MFSAISVAVRKVAFDRRGTNIDTESGVLIRHEDRRIEAISGRKDSPIHAGEIRLSNVLFRMRVAGSVAKSRIYCWSVRRSNHLLMQRRSHPRFGA